MSHVLCNHGLLNKDFDIRRRIHFVSFSHVDSFYTVLLMLTSLQTENTGYFFEFDEQVMGCKETSFSMNLIGSKVVP